MPDTVACSQLTPTMRNQSQHKTPAARHLCAKETLGGKEAYGDSPSLACADGGSSWKTSRAPDCAPQCGLLSTPVYSWPIGAFPHQPMHGFSSH